MTNKGRCGLGLTKCFIDGTFLIMKKGTAMWESPSGQGYEDHSMAVVNKSSLPVAVCAASASPHESKLVKTIKARFIEEKPERLIGGKAYSIAMPWMEAWRSP
jgi:hypothetical protein